MGRQKTYTDEQEKEVIALLRKGVKSVNISRKVDLHHTIIRSIKKKYCPELVIPRNSISDETKAEILKLILDDWIYTDIAMHFNVAISTVGIIARENGIPKKRDQPKQISKETEDEFIELVKYGMNVPEASNLLGISESSGYRICNDHGLRDYLFRREGFTEDEKGEIKRLYEEGYSYKYIQNKFNLKSPTIASSVVSNRKAKFTDNQLALLRKLVLEDGIKMKDAAEIVDMKLNTAYRYIQRYKESL